MSTAEEGGATAYTTNSSYGVGGAGGKLRKKPIRRQTTPYDRPPTALRVNNTNVENSSNWVTKLVTVTASKLISYGVDRLFPSVFRRRLPPPPPPPPQPPEIENAEESDGDQGEDLNIQVGEQEPSRGQGSLPINSSSSSVLPELEHLLKKKTFTRSEIAYLTQLLLSQVAEVSPGDARDKSVVSALDSGRRKEFASSDNRNDGIKSPAVTFTLMHNSAVLESNIASPAELAKAYMGSRSSQVSPSALGMRNQLDKDGTGLLANTLIASKSPIISLAEKTSVSMGATENGLITPRSRGKSAIYNMARTPYSRVHPNSILKGSGISANGYAGPSTSSLSLSPTENDENFDSRSATAQTLKRRSSVLDDEVGSVGPMRRIRQKPNLLDHGLHLNAHRVGISSYAKPKPQLNVEERNNVLKQSGENDSESVPSSSYAHVPSKSREVAAKILQQLEKFSPREKSSESKRAAVQEKLPSKSVSNRLLGQTVQRMDDMGSSKFLFSAPDGHKSENETNGTRSDVHGSSPQKQGKSAGNDPQLSNIPSGRWSPALKNDSAVSFKSIAPVIGASVVKNGASQPQKKRAFRMSTEEDDVQCYGLPSRSLSENKGTLASPCIKPAEESNFTVQSEDESFLGLVARNVGGHSPDASTFGQGTNVIAGPTSEGMRVLTSGPGTDVVASSVPVFPLLSSESIRRSESEPEKSRSKANITMPIESKVRTPESDTEFHLESVKVVDTNGKRGDVSAAALNGPLSLSSSRVSFPAASFSDMNGISSGSAPLFTSSTSITNFVRTGSSTGTATPSSGSIVGFAVKSSCLVGPDSNPGLSADLSTSESAAATSSFSERAYQGAKIDINPSSGFSTSSYNEAGNGIFKFGSSPSNPSGNIFQGPLFASASKTQESGVGTSSQGITNESVSSASGPALNGNTSTSLGSWPTLNSSLGFSSTSPTDTNSLVPAGAPTLGSFKFGANPTSVSEGSAVISSTSATPSSLKFDSSSSSLSTNTVGSSSSPASPIFGFGGASVSASAINTGSSFSSGASHVFGFGGSSSASSSASNSLSSSSAASNAFGSGWQSLKFPLSCSTSTFASAPIGFSFSASPSAEAPMAFNSSIGASSTPIFSFTSASSSASSLPNIQPIFGNPATVGGFAATLENNEQMNAEDSMAEDPLPSSASISAFGQPYASPSPPIFSFGSAVPSQNNPFMFNAQQNQVPPQNPSPFQASSSLEFNARSSFSLGRGGGDKSGRKIVKVNRNKYRKK